jgi:hypothetical protein
MSFKCKYCNKDYKSASSRCNHIKKFHKTDCGTVLTTTQKKFVENNQIKIKNNKDIIKNTEETDKESNSKTCKFCNIGFCKFIFVEIGSAEIIVFIDLLPAHIADCIINLHIPLILSLS